MIHLDRSPLESLDEFVSRLHKSRNELFGTPLGAVAAATSPMVYFEGGEVVSGCATASPLVHYESSGLDEDGNGHIFCYELP